MSHLTPEQETERTLSLLDSMPRTPAPPGFYGRLRTRMHRPRPRTESLAGFLTARPLAAAVATAVLIAVNVLAIYHVSTRTSDAVKTQQITSFAQEYHFTYSYY